MATHQTGEPVALTEADLLALGGRLAALRDELSPAQRAALDALVGAGLAAADPDDTAGHSLWAADPHQALRAADVRAATLQEEWRRANAGRGAGDQPAPRWDLRPLLAWLGRRPRGEGEGEGAVRARSNPATP